jgi:malate dehydrogenase (oxaloacetate-decarboxylating)(NADP+)
VATRPISDMEAYRQRLAGFVYRSGSVMEPVFAEARKTVRRVLYAEGEEDRVLRAAQVAVDEGLARPLLVGRPEVIATRIARAGLRLKPGEDCEIINVLDDVRYRACWEGYYELMKRRGISRALAKEDMRIRPTLIGAMLLRHGDTDAMLCGTTGTYTSHLTYVRQVIGLAEGATTMAAMQMLILPGRRQLFICDTHVNHDPTAEQIAEITLLAAAGVRRFGLVPSVALLSHSNFGSSPAPSAQKMRDALPLIRKRDPTLAVEGEMRGDAALSQPILRNIFPDAALTAEANLLVMPGVDAANIAFNLLRIGAGDGVTVGAILLGAAMPVHILTTSATVRRLVNMTALAAVGASHRWPSAGNHS